MTLASVLRPLARALRECELRVVLAESCTAGLASALLARSPGISQHHCGSAVTYRNATKARWLGVDEVALDKPGPVSRIVARQMAAGVLNQTPEADLAVSITGHLGPNAPAKLDGLVYIGLARRAVDRAVCPLEVRKLRLQAATRQARQREAALAALAALLAQARIDAAEIDASLPLSEWRALHEGEVDAVCLGETMATEAALRSGFTTGLIFPGSFNPLHEGHLRMADLARMECGGAVEFELSIENVDKPTLRRCEAAQRAAQLLPHGVVWLTRSPTFAEKSLLFPGAMFVVGADTLERLGDPRYYGGSRPHRDAAIKLLAERDCRFLCFGRLQDAPPQGARFCTLADLRLPRALRKICRGLDEQFFRCDTRSTDLRLARQNIR